MTINPQDADKWQDKIDGMDKDIEAVLKEEKQEKALANAEMQLKKGENMIEHEAEIKSRPKRTWFESQDDKKKAKQAGAAELNGIEKLRTSLKGKTGGKLSNKDKKRLDATSMRKEGGMWKGGKGASARARASGKGGSGARGWKKK